MSRFAAKFIAATMISAVIAGCGKKEEPPKAAPTSKLEIACTYAPSQSAVVGNLASLAGGAAVAADGIAKAAGLTAVAHSSGAYIFTGPAGYLAGTLGTAFTLPVIVGLGVTVGGAVATLELVCAPMNHPDLVARVEEAATEFVKRSKDVAVETTGKVGSLAVEVRKEVVRKGNEAFEYANRKSIEWSDAIRK